jgi:phosphopantetheine adenylyltransferase
MPEIVERLRAWHTPGETITGDVQLYLDAADEIERLRERLGPRGLEVVMIDGAGHYVNEKVKAEVERLRERCEAYMNEPIYLIWSNEHGGWWMAGGWGYSQGLNAAGQFTREDVIKICGDALPTAKHIGVISEIPVRLEDIQAMMRDRAVPDVVTLGKNR